MAAMSAMEPHHVNGSLGEWASGDIDTHTPAPAPLLREPRAPPGGANPLSTLSPSKLRPIPHPFNKQPLCQAVCRGKQKLREGPGSPLAQTTPPPSPAAHQLGDLAQVAALLRSLSLWLYRAVRLLLTSTSWRHPRYSISQGRYSV